MRPVTRVEVSLLSRRVDVTEGGAWAVRAAATSQEPLLCERLSSQKHRYCLPTPRPGAIAHACRAGALTPRRATCGTLCDIEPKARRRDIGKSGPVRWPWLQHDPAKKKQAHRRTSPSTLSRMRLMASSTGRTPSPTWTLPAKGRVGMWEPLQDRHQEGPAPGQLPITLEQLTAQLAATMAPVAGGMTIAGQDCQHGK